MKRAEELNSHRPQLGEWYADTDGTVVRAVSHRLPGWLTMMEEGESFYCYVVLYPTDSMNECNTDNWTALEIA